MQKFLLPFFYGQTDCTAHLLSACSIDCITSVVNFFSAWAMWRMEPTANKYCRLSTFTFLLMVIWTFNIMWFQAEFLQIMQTNMPFYCVEVFIELSVLKIIQIKIFHKKHIRATVCRMIMKSFTLQRNSNLNLSEYQ